MTIFCFMSVISIISVFSCQIPATEKSLKLVYVLSVLSLLSDLLCDAVDKSLRNKVLLNVL